MRRLPLSAWLGLGLVLAVTLPPFGAAAAWWAVDNRQHADLDRRTEQAAALIAQFGSLDPHVERGLAALHVEADFGTPAVKDVLAGQPSKDAMGAKDAKAAKAAAIAKEPMPSPDVMTPGLRALLMSAPDGKHVLQADFLRRSVDGADLFLRKPSTSARIAAAGLTALLVLTILLATGYVLLRRWVVRPLAQLSSDVAGVAGGQMAVSPVASPAREVAEIGAALNGMTKGLRAALAERDAAEEQRKFLVTSIAHDLRTPLFTLRGSLEAIELGIGNGNHLRRAQDKATLIDGLVTDLFTYSRLEYAGPALKREPVDAVALARKAARAVDDRIEVVASAAGACVSADRDALMRVLVNLLDNAARYASSRVEIAVEHDGDDVLFVVTDDGPGIDAEDLPHVFEPLFRADRTRNSATGGAGLGLAIVDRLTAAQEATVTASTAPTGGARFAVRYPNLRPSVP
jgi:signal transduction histidine kinase